MKKQICKLFERHMLCGTPTDYQLNEYLKEHPNYTVAKISFDNPKGTCIEHLFVVFDIHTSL